MLANGIIGSWVHNWEQTESGRQSKIQECLESEDERCFHNTSANNAPLGLRYDGDKLPNLHYYCVIYVFRDENFGCVLFMALPVDFISRVCEARVVINNSCKKSLKQISIKESLMLNLSRYKFFHLTTCCWMWKGFTTRFSHKSFAVRFRN